MRLHPVIRSLETTLILSMSLRFLNAGIIPHAVRWNKPVWTHQLLKKQSQQIRRAKERKQFHSCFYSWGNKYRDERRKFARLLQTCVWTIVDKYLIDNLKAPLWNKPRSALFVPASFDFYFGDNISQDSTNVKRTAYAQGSGVRTIGLDPKHAVVHQMFPELSELRDMVKVVLKRHYVEQGEDGLFDCEINHVSGKGYWNRKQTNLHTDIEFDKHHNPKDDNSQKPNTPVAIVCFGDPKVLSFVQFEGVGKGKRVAEMPPLHFLQTCCKIIILDPRDEQWDQKLRFWKHRSDLCNKDDGVSFSLMFRVVVKEVLVRPLDARLDGVVITDEEKQRKFDAIRHDFESRTGEFKNYEADVATLFRKIRERLMVHTKANI